MANPSDSSNSTTLVPISKIYWTFEIPPGGLPPNLTAYSVIVTFSGLALWLCLELLVQIYATFKRRRGLYFWSCLITTLALISQTVGFNLLQLFAPGCPRMLYTLIGIIGWNLDLCGFSVVLYSRLHLTGCTARTLRRFLILIITTAFIFQTPITVTSIGLATSSWHRFVNPRQMAERAQQLVYMLQEGTLSSIYIWNTFRFLHLPAEYSRRTRNVILLLITTQLFVIGCDVALATLNFVNMYTLHCILHPFVYTLKLKVEFVVLNQLRELVKHGLYERSAVTMERCNGPDSETGSKRQSQELTASIVSDGSDRTRVGSDVTLCAQDIGGDKFFAGQSIDDIEKQYLGRFGMMGITTHDLTTMPEAVR